MSKKISELPAGGAFTATSEWETNSGGGAPSVRRNAAQAAAYYSAQVKPERGIFLNNLPVTVTGPDGTIPIVNSPGIGSLVIPANSWQVGTTLTVTVLFQNLDPDGNVPEVDIKFGFFDYPIFAEIYWSGIGDGWIKATLTLTATDFPSANEVNLYASVNQLPNGGGAGVIGTIDPTIDNTLRIEGYTTNLSGLEQFVVHSLVVTRSL